MKIYGLGKIYGPGGKYTVLGRKYTVVIFSAHITFSGTVYSQREDRLFSLIDDSLIILIDHIFHAKISYIFSDGTVYFQDFRTVCFKPRTVYFQPSGPYNFSLDRIFTGHPLWLRLQPLPFRYILNVSYLTPSIFKCGLKL